ncbi:hypothetical protein AB5I41_13375 [Sphingomonas sp. MMS24-JH45]
MSSRTTSGANTVNAGRAQDGSGNGIGIWAVSTTGAIAVTSGDAAGRTGIFAVSTGASDAAAGAVTVNSTTASAGYLGPQTDGSKVAIQAQGSTVVVDSGPTARTTNGGGGIVATSTDGTTVRATETRVEGTNGVVHPRQLEQAGQHHQRHAVHGRRRRDRHPRLLRYRHDDRQRHHRHQRHQRARHPRAAERDGPVGHLARDHRHQRHHHRQRQRRQRDPHHPRLRLARRGHDHRAQQRGDGARHRLGRDPGVGRHRRDQRHQQYGDRGARTGIVASSSGGSPVTVTSTDVRSGLSGIVANGRNRATIASGTVTIDNAQSGSFGVGLAASGRIVNVTSGTIAATGAGATAGISVSQIQGSTADNALTIASGSIGANGNGGFRHPGDRADRTGRGDEHRPYHDERHRGLRQQRSCRASPTGSASPVRPAR